MHQPVKLFMRYSICVTGQLLWKVKFSMLYSFVQQAVSAPVPVQYFYLVTVTVMEHEQCTAHRVKSELLLHYGRKAVKPFPHVRIRCGDVYFCRNVVQHFFSPTSTILANRIFLPSASSSLRPSQYLRVLRFIPASRHHSRWLFPLFLYSSTILSSCVMVPSSLCFFSIVALLGRFVFRGTLDGYGIQGAILAFRALILKYPDVYCNINVQILCYEGDFNATYK